MGNGKEEVAKHHAQGYCAKGIKVNYVRRQCECRQCDEGGCHEYGHDNPVYL